MRIVNTTGFSHDTKILDDQGRDITGDMRVVKIEIEVGDLNRATITCLGVEVDVVGDEQSGKSSK